MGGSDMTETVDTRYLHVTVDPRTAMWSVRHKLSGSAIAQIGPGFEIAGYPVDLGNGRSHVEVADIENELGSFTAVTMNFKEPGGLDISYRLLVSRTDHDVIVELGFVNHTGHPLIVHTLEPVRAVGVSLPGDSAGWLAIGDGKTYRDPYIGHTMAESMETRQAWWYAAVKDPASGASVLLGNLTNHKALGRFTWTYKDQADTGLHMTARCDYEQIEMPAGETILPEQVLLNFGACGTDSLERFGDLIAKAHDIDLMKMAPIDPDDPTISSVFNLWNAYGSGVVRKFEYGHDKTKHEWAYQDADWRRENLRLFDELGLRAFIHPDPPPPRATAAGVTPLVRNYGKPDWWFPEAREFAAAHPELYIDGRIDFSNPEALALEDARAASLFEGNDGKLISYGTDFTNEWQKLPGQANPFRTSAETFHAAMKPWRTRSRRHRGGCYASTCMNVIGFSYDVWDILRISEDGDQAYHGHGCTFAEGLIRQASGRYFYNGRVWWNSADSFHVYCQGLYSYGQAKVHASFCALAGNHMMVAEPFCDEDLPADRLDIIKKVLPTTHDVATAVDLFEHNPARLWNLPVKRPFAEWNVVGLFNFNVPEDNKPLTQEIRFRDLSLSSEQDYLVYEFWTQTFLGCQRGAFTPTLQAPDCGVYAVVAMREHPVLVSTSRNVRQMAYDILTLEWDEDAGTLSGRSRVVAGDPYELRVFVPDGYTFRTASAGALPVAAENAGGLLTLRFTPRENGTVDWCVEC